MKLVLQKFKVLFNQELIRKSAVSLVLKVVGMALGYLVMFYITNYYGDEAWGIYSLCFTILSIAIVVPKFGFDVSLVRIITELNISSDKKSINLVIVKALIISSLLAFLSIGVILFSKGFITSSVLKDGLSEDQILIVSYAILPMVFLVIFCSVFQALKKISLFILFQTVLLNLIFLVLLVINKYYEFTSQVFLLYVYAIALNLLLSIVVFLISFLLKKDSRHNLTSKIIGYKEIINVSTPMLLSGSFALFMGWSDILMLSYFKTTTDVGIYSASLKIASIAGITLIAINSIATPKFVEHYTKRDFNGLSKVVRNSTKMIFFTTTPVLIVLVLFPKTILGLLGSSFTIASITLIILCFSRFINAISGSVGYIMQMTDQQKTYQNIIFIAFLINLVLNYFLIPVYSYTGAAIASSVAMIFWNLALVIIIKRKLGFWTIYIPFLSR